MQQSAAYPQMASSPYQQQYNNTPYYNNNSMGYNSYPMVTPNALSNNNNMTQANYGMYQQQEYPQTTNIYNSNSRG